VQRGLAAGEPGSKPKTSSVQVASGSVVKAATSSGGRRVVDGPTQRVSAYSRRIADPLQRVSDDMAWLDRYAEQGRRHNTSATLSCSTADTANPAHDPCRAVRLTTLVSLRACGAYSMLSPAFVTDLWT